MLTYANKGTYLVKKKAPKMLTYTAKRTAVNPTAFRSVPFQDVIQKQF